jgi:cathepsin C
MKLILTDETQYENEINFHDDFKSHHKVVDRLNSEKITKSWEAGVNTGFLDLSIKQLNHRAGRQKMYTPSPKKPIMLEKYEDSSNSKYQNYAVQDINDLPKSFNWLNKLREPKAQGDCGSCYTFATLSMLEARLKIKFEEDVKLSVQHSIDCNFFNQGCDGGYPYLVETWATNYDLVPEECHPYKVI